MSLFVYTADECKNNALRHGLYEELQRFEKRVEESQSLTLFDPFPEPYRSEKLGGRRHGWSRRNMSLESTRSLSLERF